MVSVVTISLLNNWWFSPAWIINIELSSSIEIYYRVHDIIAWKSVDSFGEIVDTISRTWFVKLWNFPHDLQCLYQFIITVWPIIPRAYASVGYFLLTRNNIKAAGFLRMSSFILCTVLESIERTATVLYRIFVSTSLYFILINRPIFSFFEYLPR